MWILICASDAFRSALVLDHTGWSFQYISIRKETEKKLTFKILTMHADIATLPSLKRPCTSWSTHPKGVAQVCTSSIQCVLHLAFINLVPFRWPDLGALLSYWRAREIWRMDFWQNLTYFNENWQGLSARRHESEFINCCVVLVEQHIYYDQFIPSLGQKVYTWFILLNNNNYLFFQMARQCAHS